MPTSARLERVAQEVRAAVADLFTRGQLRDPRIRYLTITGVKMSPDLKVAKVYYSMMGTDEEKRETQAGLDAAKGFVRHEVTARVKLRSSPEIYFSYDPSIDEGDKIDRLLKQAKAKEGW